MRILLSRKLTRALFAVTALTCLAQNDSHNVTETILQKDALFWNVYNGCNTAAMPAFFTGRRVLPRQGWNNGWCG